MGAQSVDPEYIAATMSSMTNWLKSFCLEAVDEEGFLML